MILQNEKRLLLGLRFYKKNVIVICFTESCKKLTALCHNHRRLYQRIVFRRYFTDSYKKITTPAIIIDEFTDEITDG